MDDDPYADDEFNRVIWESLTDQERLDACFKATYYTFKYVHDHDLWQALSNTWADYIELLAEQASSETHRRVIVEIGRAVHR